MLYTDNDPQVEDLRGELMGMRKEKTELQRTRLEAFQPAAPPHGHHIDRQEGGSGQRAPGTECGPASTGWDADYSLMDGFKYCTAKSVTMKIILLMFFLPTFFFFFLRNCV